MHRGPQSWNPSPTCGFYSNRREVPGTPFSSHVALNPLSFGNSYFSISKHSDRYDATFISKRVKEKELKPFRVFIPVKKIYLYVYIFATYMVYMCVDVI